VKAQIRRINSPFLLRHRNVEAYGRVSPDAFPGRPHKGQPATRFMVAEFIAPLVTAQSAIVDLGCRNLDLAVLLHDRAATISVDICPDVVKWAQEWGYRAVCADATCLPFDDGSMDIVYASHIFEHVPDLALALYETMRVLKRGGHLFSRVPLLNYYRHHRFYIDSASAFADEIAQQGECAVLHAEERLFLDQREAVVLVRKDGLAHHRHRHYPYDWLDTLRGMAWRVRQGCVKTP